MVAFLYKSTKITELCVYWTYVITMGGFYRIHIEPQQSC